MKVENFKHFVCKFYSPEIVPGVSPDSSALRCVNSGVNELYDGWHKDAEILSNELTVYISPWI